MTAWHSDNYPHAIPDDLTGDFSITCSSGTDLWRMPPDTNRSDNPFIYQTIRASDFSSARVTVTGDWQELYDQGGLCLIIHDDHSGPPAARPRWVKSGIEKVEGHPRVSCVATDVWSDWSLHPVVAKDKKSATIEFVVKHQGDGSLWVYLLDEDTGERYPLREITWWKVVSPDAHLKIGVAAAKPSTNGGDLRVRYRGLEIKSRVGAV